MSQTPFMPLWVSDFLGDTLELNSREIGAYMLLLMSMWQRNGTLPDDTEKLKRVARCGREWPKVWSNLKRFFIIEEGTIRNKRLSLELQKCVAKREVKRQQGALGGRAKALKDKERGLANATVSLQQPDTITRKVPPNGGTPPTPKSELMEVLDEEHAAAVIEHRQRIRSPLTPRAGKMLANKFSQCPDPNAAADEMIVNGWRGFEPDWIENRKGNGNGRGQGPTFADLSRQLEESIAADEAALANSSVVYAFGAEKDAQ